MEVKYEIYLINKAKVVLGEVRHISKNLRITKSMNLGDSIEFTINYEQFKDHVGKNGNPRTWLIRGATDIVVFRNGKPFAASRLATWIPKFNTDGIWLDIKGEPLVNFYVDQYITVNFTTDTAQGDIVWAVINACNSKPNGDYGIRKGDNVALFPRQRNEIDKQVKDFITRMTRVRSGLDFEITISDEIMGGAYTKYLQTYDMMGTYHKNELWIYPEDQGIKDFSIDVGDDIYNVIIAIGSGNGDAAIRTTQEDTDSQEMYYRRERIVTYNSIVNMQPLLENAQGVLDGVKTEIELPKFTFQHGRLDLERIKVGDSISAKVLADDLFNIDGVYRIVEVAVSVSSEDVETPVVTFDNYSIEDILEGQESSDD